MSPPRLIADEMVGSLARYLRMMGCDTRYARGWSDEEILDHANAEGRVLLTRDRQLARRAAKAVLLTSSRLEDQVRMTWAALPGVPSEVRFDRCTVCNGLLARYEPAVDAPRQEGVPWDRVAKGLPLFRCNDCGHLYWEGSHTANVRRRLDEWSRGRG